MNHIKMQRAALGGISGATDINNGVGGEASLLDAFCFSTKIKTGFLEMKYLRRAVTRVVGIVVGNHEAPEDAQRFSGNAPVRICSYLPNDKV